MFARATCSSGDGAGTGLESCGREHGGPSRTDLPVFFSRLMGMTVSLGALRGDSVDSCGHMKRHGTVESGSDPRRVLYSECGSSG